MLESGIMPIKTFTDGIRERSGSWQLRKTVKLPDGKSLRIEQTLGNKDVMTRMQASEKAIKLQQKVQEYGLTGLNNFASTYASMGHNRMSIGAIIDEYITLAKTRGTKRTKNKPFRKRTIELFEMDRKGRWEELLHYDISTIDPEFIKGWYMRNMEEYAPATENAFRRLYTIFDYAIGEGYIETNPCTMMAKSQIRYVIGTKDRRLSLLQNEIGQFAKAIIEHRTPQKKKLDQVSLDAIVTMLFTGRRKSEIFNLRWSWFSDVKHFRSFTVPAEFVSDTFEGAKTHADYYVACSKILMEMFANRYTQRENLCNALGHDGAMEFVFPSRGRADKPISDVDARIKIISKYAGLGTLTPHDFKRTFTDIVGQSALPDRIIKYITAHKQNDITFGRYTNEQSRLQIHQGFQFVEDYVSQTIPFDYLVGNKVEKFSGKTEIDLDNKGTVDRKASTPEYFRKAYHNRFFSFRHTPLPKAVIEKRKEFRRDNYTDYMKDYDTRRKENPVRANTNWTIAKGTIESFHTLPRESELKSRQAFQVIKDTALKLMNEVYLYENTSRQDQIQNITNFDKWKKDNPKIKVFKDGMQVDKLTRVYDNNLRDSTHRTETSKKMINEIKQVNYEQAIAGIKLKGVWLSYLSKKTQKKIAKTIRENPPKNKKVK